MQSHHQVLANSDINAEMTEKKKREKTLDAMENLKVDILEVSRLKFSHDKMEAHSQLVMIHGGTY
jgi:hypothetical protein